MVVWSILRSKKMDKYQLKKNLQTLGIKVYRKDNSLVVFKRDVVGFLAKAKYELPSLGRYPMIVAYMLNPMPPYGQKKLDPSNLNIDDLYGLMEIAVDELNLNIDLDSTDNEVDDEFDTAQESDDIDELSPTVKQIYADFVKAYKFQQTLPTLEAKEIFAYTYLLLDENGDVLTGSSYKEDLKDDAKDYRASGKKVKAITRAKVKPEAFNAYFNKYNE
jgi:hypothetical protein